MKTPKLLPWHARKAGISIERAEALWRKALHEATADTGWVGTSEFWGAANARFLELLQAERAEAPVRGMVPLVRSQAQMWRVPLQAAEDFWSLMAANWQRQCEQMRKAA